MDRIAVLRGGGLGDLMMVWPALESLAAAYPGAEITLLGTPGHRALLAGRDTVVTRTEVLPPAAGVRPGPEDPEAVEGFLTRLREPTFDLAVQLHGGGRNSNPFLLRLGARHTVGTRTEDAAALERSVPYVLYQHETQRALEVVGQAGAPAVQLEPRFPLTEVERAARSRSRSTERAPVVVLHPGATDPRRCWPAAAYAEVAAALAGDGAEVRIVGDDADRALAAGIVAEAQHRAAPPGSIRSLAGEQSLGELLVLLAEASVVVGNDSGPRHLAAALGTATVGIFWAGNAILAGPVSRGRHRMHLGWIVRCPVCGVDCTQVGWTAPRCEHDESLVSDVPVAAVLADARRLLATAG